MAAIFQTTSSHAFSWMKMYKFWLIFHWSLLPKVQSIIFEHWFRKWLGAVQATSHYLNQCCLVSWRIYALLGLNELKRDLTHRQIGEHGTILHHSKHDCEVVKYHTGNLTFNYMMTPIKLHKHILWHCLQDFMENTSFAGLVIHLPVYPWVALLTLGLAPLSVM